jgi:hypothetical protein
VRQHTGPILARGGPDRRQPPLGLDAARMSA